MDFFYKTITTVLLGCILFTIPGEIYLWIFVLTGIISWEFILMIYYEGYIENNILNRGLAQVNEKREALISLTTYNNVNQFRSITEKNLTYHISKIKKVFSEELSKESIDYENLKSVTNREMELFEQETINQLNKIF